MKLLAFGRSLLLPCHGALTDSKPVQHLHNEAPTGSDDGDVALRPS
ncbi:hypothetical protein [Halomicronema sp. CCY15110]|nr:hypothetical protein [Halomicronema sp. CCY15110]